MTFDDLWSDAIEVARGRLSAKGSTAAPLVDRVSKSSLPGMLALLSGPRRDGQRDGSGFISQVATAAAAAPEVKDSGLDAGAIEAVLKTVFVDRKLPSSTGKSDDALLAVVTNVLEKEGVDVSAAEGREVLQLLETGRFYGDIADSLGAIFATVPHIPAALLKDVPRLPRIPLSAPPSLIGDLLELLRSIPRVAADMRDGRLDQPPATMARALAVLYGFATVGEIRDLLKRLLDPGNRSIRLALLLYARSNGFDVTEQDLDVVYKSLLASDHPDLGPVLADALEFMKRRYGGNELETVLGALQQT